MEREYVLQRYSANTESTMGVMIQVMDQKRTKFIGYTLEDQFQEYKVLSETRIPSGRYEIVINPVDTPLTKRYRARYKWFEKHLMLKEVPGFAGIYIHIGNTDADTAGCLLLGDIADNNMIGRGSVSNSTACFQRFYDDAYDYLTLKGNKAFITVLDEKHLIL